jgi:hypothetical protein
MQEDEEKKQEKVEVLPPEEESEESLVWQENPYLSPITKREPAAFPWINSIHSAWN